jgi:hypothetical protein
MQRTLILLSLAVGLFAGCTSLRDARGPSEICEVHHAFMHAEEVPGPKSAVQLDPSKPASDISRIAIRIMCPTRGTAWLSTYAMIARGFSKTGSGSIEKAVKPPREAVAKPAFGRSAMR